MENKDVAALLDEWADILEDRGEPGYRRRAYRIAARRVAGLEESVAEMVRSGRDLRVIPGIGDKLSHRIKTIVNEGAWPELEAARKEPRRMVLAGGQGMGDFVNDEGVLRGMGAGGHGLLKSLRGDLHVHTDATDGRDPLPDMVEAAKRRGYEYIAITDHSKETRIAGGLDETGMRMHHARIRRLAEKVEGITILAGAEVDILKDGRLDFPDALLRDMDVVVCSLHFRHKLEAKQQTERILTAMSNDHADILGHPTGRRRGIRPGIELDIPRLVEAAKGQGWAIEMNGSPERMDLDAKSAAIAASAGVMLSLDSDAHATEELAQVRNCCREAEAAGVTAAQVLNAQPLSGLRRLLSV